MCNLTIFRAVLALVLGSAAFAFWSRVRLEILCTLKRFTCWLLSLAFGWFEPVFARAIDALPDFPAADLSLVGVVLGAVNLWFPLTEAALLCIAYLVFAIGWIVYRNLKSWLPMVGS